ncbi:zinc transport system ATP-binding protein [Melghirimyces profundicolus]|uniref:Zinc transport system ATP-binding protein n=1 Tax=Melghirimyces profundicolus TaxID=1242148 RepID=A0A2T6BAG4_9BACL|nr:metal ABC transporter ATP-binding protein [Melghirimyces profundicolus]PTX53081.1 zinc transport system ATP-binding protein [Melghirimyces profundicolus]
MGETVLKMEGIDFSFDHQTVLEGVDLEIQKGDFLALVGPNGSGKSTLLKLALGALKPDRGKVSLFGVPLRRFRDWSRIGYVSQKANSFNRDFPATVREVVASGLYGKLGLFRRMKKEDWKRVEEAIKQVGLESLSRRNIGKLSGGQQQRAFIARALVSDPEFLILDEPTVGVDTRSVDEFYRLLAHLHRKKGMSLLLVTHDIGVVTTYVNRIACLNRRLFFHGDTDEFVGREKEVFTAAYGHPVQVVEHAH